MPTYLDVGTYGVSGSRCWLLDSGLVDSRINSVKVGAKCLSWSQLHCLGLHAGGLEEFPEDYLIWS